MGRPILILFIWIISVIVIVSAGVSIYNYLSEPVRSIVVNVLVITAPAAGVFAILYD